MSRGRKKTDSLLKLRTLVWYWGVRYITGLRDGKLDMKFTPIDTSEPKRVYADRIRIFEDIKKSGCSITRGNHRKRNFDLLEIVNATEGLEGSSDFYNTGLWDFLNEKDSTIESTTLHMATMIGELELYKLPMRGPSAANANELRMLSELTNLTEERIWEIQTYEIQTINREPYDNVLNSLCKFDDYLELLNKLDFYLLTKYLNNLSFFIAFYRYAMLTSNFHALISAADKIDEYLFILFIQKAWDRENITKKLAHEIHFKVFKGTNQKDLKTMPHLQKFNFFENESTLAINKFMNLIN